MKRLILPLIAGIAIVYAAMSILKNQTTAEKHDPPSPPPESPFMNTIAATGIVEPNSEIVAIGTALPGVVSEVMAKVGQTVNVGDPLFRLDDRNLKAELGMRKAALVSAMARVQVAEAAQADVADQLARATKLGSGTGGAISTEELMKRKFAVEAAEAKLAEARAEVGAAQAGVAATETELERSTVRSPIAGEVLQVKVRVGEFAPAGQTAEPLMSMGRLHPLYVRVDVDEHEGWRVAENAAATGQVRGNATLKVPLKFVRFEPMVIPKKSLTGDATERVDTRVLQVIYEVTDEAVRLYVGQQMDVFIDGKAATDRTVSR